MTNHCQNAMSGCRMGTRYSLARTCDCRCTWCGCARAGELAASDDAAVLAKIINMVHDGTPGTLYEHAEVAVHATLGRLSEARMEREAWIAQYELAERGCAALLDGLRRALEMLDGEAARRQPRSGEEQQEIRELRALLRGASYAHPTTDELRAEIQKRRT